MLDDRLDRCEAGAAGDEDDRLVRLFAQKKSAERTFEAQDVALLHGFKNRLGKCAPGDVADMQFQKRIVVRRIGQRETARFLILEQNVDVLSGQELQAFIGGQLEREHHDIRRGPLHCLHTARQGLDGNILDRIHFAAFEGEVGKRLGAAEQGHAHRFLGIRQSVFLKLAIVHLPCHHPALAGAAHPVATTVGQRVAMFDRSFEYGLVRLDGEAVAAGLNNGLESHNECCVLRKGADFNA